MSRRRRLEQGSLFALSLLPLMMAASGASAQALPSGGTVVSGAAQIGYTSPADMLVTQTSGKAIINWGDFSIEQGKSVTFENGTGATLNRVTGANVSNLQGALNATGSVYLINPNGVIIGSTGVVNVGGTFVASTLNLTDANFLAGGTLTFEGPSTAVVKNLGRVGALGGDVSLIAATVTNEGTIQAGGTAGLAAGKKVTVSEASQGGDGPPIRVLMGDASLNDGRFKVEIGAGDVTNIGAIQAAEAELRANGGNIYALAGNTGGSISTRNTNNNPDFAVMSPSRGGNVFLTAGTGNVTSDGTILAREVTMQGAQVAIAGSQVEASLLAIDANAFTIGDAEAAVLNKAMIFGDYDIETGQGSFGGASVSIITRTGDIVLDTNDVDLNIGDRQLNLTAFGNVTLNDAITATRTYEYQWGTFTYSGYLNARSDSTGTGAGVVSGVRMNQGQAFITSNVANYSDYQSIVDDLNSANPTAGIDFHMLVNSYADLKRMATDADGDLSGQFVLSHDIDASASSAGGYVGANFAGQFDGAGYSISNLQVTGENAGLFASLNGAYVSNLNLVGGSATGTVTAGGLAAMAANSQIDGVTSSMSVIGLAGAGQYATGGLVGQAYQTSIYSSEVTGDVTGANKVGGLVGDAYQTGVYGSRFDGEVTGANKVGGVVGFALEGAINGVEVNGTVTGANKVGGVAGGFVGSWNSGIDNSDVSATVTGSGNTGGLVGYLNTAHISGGGFEGTVIGGDSTGGVAGFVENGSGVLNSNWNVQQIQYVTVSGSVTGDSNTGGLVGYLGSQTSIRSSVSNAVVSGRDAVGGAVGGNYAGRFENVTANGDVTASGTNVGGLVGESGGVIVNGYAHGDVTGAGGVGGLVGYSTGAIRYSAATGAVTGKEIQIEGDWVETAVGGLVGYNYYGAIENSTASGAVSGEGTAFGGLVGYFYGASVSSSSASGAVTGQGHVGGLFGVAGNLTLNNSYASGAVTGGVYEGNIELDGPATATGGLVGYGRDGLNIFNSSNTGKVIGQDNTGGLIGLAGVMEVHNTWNTGDVEGHDNVGGLIGLISPSAGNRALVDNSYASGKVTGRNFIGGLIGHIVSDSEPSEGMEGTIDSSTTVIDSYASGAVSGTAVVGGLIGMIDDGDVTVTRIYATGKATGSATVGGLIGLAGAGVTVSDGYATGKVTGDNDVGGLFGAVDGATAANLYWDTTTSGTTNAVNTGALAGTTGLTRTQAFDASSYTFSDSENWVFIDGVRPMLASEWSTTINNVHQLQLMGQNTSANYTLGRDFSAAETGLTGSGMFKDGFVTISQFNGYLDGQGRTISDLNIYSSSGGNVGLFGTINEPGVVYDLRLAGGSVMAGSADATGSIAGQNYGTIENVSSSMSVGGNAISGKSGGLVGYNAGRISLSAFKGDVSGYNTGGIAGENASEIFDSYVSGSVSGVNKVGGIVGNNSGGALDGVLAVGSVNGAGKLGALVGFNTGSVQNARWSTTVSGNLAGVNGSVGDNVFGYSTADLQDETRTGEVYQGFNLDVWAPGSSAAVSSDAQAHFAELYQTDDILFINANNQGTYGDYDFSTNYSIDGYQRDDGNVDVNVDSSAYGASTHAGTYQLDVQTTITGSRNYRVIKLNTLTVNKRQVYVDLTGGVTKTYDGTDSAVLTNDVFTKYNVLDGDDLTVSGVGTFGGVGVGSGKMVFTGDLVLSGANAGDYELVVEQAGAQVGYINHALVTGTVNASKTYDGTTAVGPNTSTGFTGLIEGDTLEATFSNLAFDGKNAGTGKTVRGNVSVDLRDSNYGVTSFDVSGTGQINAKTITAGLSGTVTKTYDGTTSATLGSSLGLSGLVEGDTVTAGATSATYNGKNVGTGKTVTASGVTLGGVDAGNYVLVSDTVSADIGKIDAKTIQAVLNGSITKTYDGATSATLGDSLGLSGVVAGETVTIASTGAAYDNKNAGTGKTVTASGVSIGGADAGNYVLASTTASANVGVIQQKALTITADGKVKDRNNADPALTYVATGLVAGDALTGALTREAGEAVGTYGILQGTLSGGGNYAVTYNRALLTINLGIPPVENLIIPYIPADGGGSTQSGGSAGSGGAGGQKDGGNTVGFQMAVLEGGEDPSSKQDKGGDDTTTCAAGDTCQSAPYTQGGSTSGAIHFQGFMH